MSTTATILDALDEQQRAAVESEAVHTHVVAGPGSGKTRVVVARIVWLLREKQMPSHSILVFAFTRAAAGEIRRRVDAEVGVEMAKLLTVTTFHSWALRMLRRADVLPEGLRIASAEESDEVLRGIYKGPERRPEARKAGIRSVQGYWHVLAAHGLEYVAGLDIEVARVVEIHRTRLRERGLIPVEEVLPNLMRAWNELFAAQHDIHHVIVDEAHDLTQLEARIVRRIACPTTVVSDPRQCIFEWRGASPEALAALAEGAVTIQLDRSYRFPDGIAAEANRVLDSHGYGSIHGTGEGRSVFMSRIPFPDVVGLVHGEVKQRGARRVAVLCRTNIECERIAAEIGPVAHVVRKPDNLILTTAVAIMRLAVNHDDDAAFRHLWFMEGDGPEAMREIEEGAGHARSLLAELYAKGKPHRILEACWYDVPGIFGVAWHRAKAFWNAPRDPDNVELARYSDVISLPPDEALHALSELADADGFAAVGDRVAVATIHAAKGREWDAVFVQDFPQRDVEDARVRFVAYTRAREFLAVFEGASTW